MAGTRIGGLKAAVTVKAKYGDDFYKNIGCVGGRKGHTGGFAADPMLAKIAGSKGGRISRRGPKLSEEIKEARKKEKEERWKRAQRFVKLENADGDI